MLEIFKAQNFATKKDELILTVLQDLDLFRNDVKM